MAERERDIYTCFSCGLVDQQVEAGGIWYCPNKFCLGTGAWGPRIKAGYQDEDGTAWDWQINRAIQDCRAEIRNLLYGPGLLERWIHRLLGRVFRCDHATIVDVKVEVLERSLQKLKDFRAGRIS